MPATPPLRLSIVVPTLDEEEALDAALASAAAADEIVVSDGGSRDRTLEVARRHRALVVVGAAGRGAQLNRGAAAASGDVLLFLHADTLLPPAAIEVARAAVAGGAAGGAFQVRFDLDSPLYRFGARMINQARPRRPSAVREPLRVRPAGRIPSVADSRGSRLRPPAETPRPGRRRAPDGGDVGAPLRAPRPGSHGGAQLAVVDTLRLRRAAAAAGRALSSRALRTARKAKAPRRHRHRAPLDSTRRAKRDAVTCPC